VYYEVVERGIEKLDVIEFTASLIKTKKLCEMK